MQWNCLPQNCVLGSYDLKMPAGYLKQLEPLGPSSASSSCSPWRTQLAAWRWALLPSKPSVGICHAGSRSAYDKRRLSPAECVRSAVKFHRLPACSTGESLAGSVQYAAWSRCGATLVLALLMILLLVSRKWRGNVNLAGSLPSYLLSVWFMTFNTQVA